MIIWLHFLSLVIVHDLNTIIKIILHFLEILILLLPYFILLFPYFLFDLFAHQILDFHCLILVIHCFKTIPWIIIELKTFTRKHLIHHFLAKNVWIVLLLRYSIVIHRSWNVFIILDHGCYAKNRTGLPQILCTLVAVVFRSKLR